jgi:hypothetical protein
MKKAAIDLTAELIRMEGRYPLWEKLCASLVYLLNPKCRFHLVDEFYAAVNVHDGGGGFDYRAFECTPFVNICENERRSEELCEVETFF